jgi:hypothetical protein
VRFSKGHELDNGGGGGRIRYGERPLLEQKGEATMKRFLKRSIMLLPVLTLALSLNLGMAALPPIDSGHYCMLYKDYNCGGYAYTCYCIVVRG